jgi:hypothetical protein
MECPITRTLPVPPIRLFASETVVTYSARHPATDSAAAQVVSFFE